MPLPCGRSRQNQYQHHDSYHAHPFIRVAVAWYCLVVVHGLSISSAARPTLLKTPSLGNCKILQTCQRRTPTPATAAASAAVTPPVITMSARGRRQRTLVVIGGGAAGYFGAIQAASSNGGANTDALKVVVLEAGRLPLQKVKISGGGRCNVMHDSSKAVPIIAQGYPRGSKQLIGPFKSLFGPADAAAWFKARGVTLKTERDGRMFPITDDSQTIIDCLEGAASKAAVDVVTSARVASVVRRPNTEGTKSSNSSNDSDDSSEAQQPRFDLVFTTAKPLSPTLRKALRATAAPAKSAGAGAGNAAGRGGAKGDGVGPSSAKVSYHIVCDYVLQATGAAREGHGWAERLGHAVSTPVPSLFTLTVRDPRLEGLAGLSVQDAELKLFAEKLAEEGGSTPVQSGGGKASGGVIDGDADTGNKASGDTAQAAEALEEGNKTKKKKKKKKTKAVSQRGPLLITHTGVSGPAALKLSAFGARVLNESGYKGKLAVNWLAENNPSKALEELQAFRSRNSKKTVYAFCPIGVADAAGPSSSALPRRLWQSLALAAGVSSGDRWADVSKAKLSALAQQLTACDFKIVGKGSFKEEFVTCGGVALSALDMRTMESRHVPGLFFAGEVVDIDGVTGGFNFQSAWTTGWVAGSSISARAVTESTAAGSESRLSDGDREMKEAASEGSGTR